MDILGAVTVATTTIVKVVSYIGMTGAGLALGIAALASMNIPLGPPLLTEKPIQTAAVAAIGFVAALEGWHLADWIEGRAAVVSAKSRQEAELQRLQSAQGVAL